MSSFQLFAQPWWVNLLFLLPFACYFIWRNKKLQLTQEQLRFTAIFGIAFGFVEAAVVVYLRAAVGLLTGYGNTGEDIAALSAPIYQQAQILSALPKSLLIVETIREAVTMVILVTIAMLAVKQTRERIAAYLWTFA